MTLKRYNKAGAAALATAVMAIIGVFVDMDPELMGAVSTFVTAGLVWLVPNAEA